jgi:hypothetical protein
VIFGCFSLFSSYLKSQVVEKANVIYATKPPQIILAQADED